MNPCPRSLHVASFALLAVSLANAQVGIGGLPPSRAHDLAPAPLDSLAPLELVPSASSTRERQPTPHRFGIERGVDLGTANAGVWDTLPDGSRVWRLRVRSAGAFSLNLVFDRFDLPRGARLWVCDGQRERVLGAFSSEHRTRDGRFATQPVAGDELQLEYVEPSDAAGVDIHLSQVVHAFSDVFARGSAQVQSGVPGTSGSCNVDVNCALGAAWQAEKRSVARVVMGGSLCSGALISNSAQDARQLFLTANHCFEGSPHESTWLFNFNFEASTCGGAQVASDDWVLGAALKTRSTAADHCLLEITQPIPPSFGVHYAGWSRSGIAAGSATGIHHPSGDAKKICRDSDPLSASNFLGSPCWHVEEWEQGVTEGGSSGSPLFDSDRHIVGQLYGGAAFCGYVYDDYYGRFDVSWNHGLAPHLDPIGYGEVALGGLEPDCGRPVAYCTPKTTSSGLLPRIGYSGLPALATNDFVLRLSDAEPFKPCLLISGQDTQELPFHGGYLCLRSPYTRSVAAATDANGNASMAFPLWNALQGATFGFQFWFRDGAAPFGDGFSDALRATITNGIAPIAPPRPNGLVVLAVGTDWVRLGWQDTASDESAYRVAVLAPGEDPNNPAHWDNVGGDLAPDTTSYTVGGLTQDSTYRFKVRSKNACGYSLYSTVIQGTPACVAPAAPTNLSISADSPTSLRLTWQDNSSDEVEYRVARLDPGEDPNVFANWDHVLTVPANTTSCFAGGLTSGAQYCFRVRGKNACGAFSPYTNDACGTAVCPAPNAPTGLVVTSFCSDRVSLSWTDNATDEVEYRIARLDPGEDPNNQGHWDHVGTVGVDQTSFVATGLAEWSTYQFKVRGRSGCGTLSGYTNTVVKATVGVPSKPTNCVATRQGNTTGPDPILVTWAHNGSLISGFRVARMNPNAGNPANTSDPAWNGVSGNLADPALRQWLDTSVTLHGQTYYYMVRAYLLSDCGTLYSAYSNYDPANP